MKIKKRVLVVDDEPGVIRFVKTSLSLAGYEVFTSMNGEEALQLVKSARPDIMLLDILMTPMSGLDVLKKLREFSQIPVIVFTARGDIASLAMKAGASDFIGKPFKPDELTKKIKEVLGHAGDAGSQGDDSLTP